MNLLTLWIFLFFYVFEKTFEKKEGCNGMTITRKILDVESSYKSIQNSERYVHFSKCRKKFCTLSFYA